MFIEGPYDPYFITWELTNGGASTDTWIFDIEIDTPMAGDGAEVINIQFNEK